MPQTGLSGILAQLGQATQNGTESLFGNLTRAMSNAGQAANQKFNELTGVPPPRTPPPAPPQAPQMRLAPVRGYRADPAGKYGGTDGLETMPMVWGDPHHLNFNAAGTPEDMYTRARALAHSAQYGVPQLTATQLAALALKEGRSDFGAGVYDFNNPHSEALHQKLVGQGVDEISAEFPAIVAEKMAVSKRLGIPFAEAWNGTGSNGRSTGAQYAVGYQAALKAAQNPKNAALVQFIQSALNAGGSR